MFGIKIVREDGKTNWMDIRRVFYCLLITWVIAIRLMGMDPFDDIFSGKITLATFFDLLGVTAIYLLAYHVVWSARPKL